MAEITQYDSAQSLLNHDKRDFKQPMEKDKLKNLLTLQIAKVIERKIHNWQNFRNTQDRKVVGNVGVRTPIGKKMQVDTTLRGHHLGAERVYTEQLSRAKDIPDIHTVKLHLTVEASPTILAFKRIQKQASEVLSAFSELERSKIAFLSPSVRIKNIDKNVHFVVTTRSGSYNWKTDQILAPSDALIQYKDALDASLTQTSPGAPKLNNVSKQALIREILEQSEDDKEAGIMNIHILAGENVDISTLLQDMYILSAPKNIHDLIFIPLAGKETVAIDIGDYFENEKTRNKINEIII